MRDLNFGYVLAAKIPRVIVVVRTASVGLMTWLTSKVTRLVLSLANFESAL